MTVVARSLRAYSRWEARGYHISSFAWPGNPRGASILECKPTPYTYLTMGAYYDEIEIEDMAWDPEKGVYHYPCPCGDRFEISRRQLADCEDIATCPSCSLIIRVIFDPLDFEDEPSDGEASDLGAADDSDAESDDDAFEDAMEHLSISNESPAVTVTV
ncbi:zf-CSL-domain-containing protein [Pleurotus eryngii]|uniref:Diphthamide biosynthesis protein 3 n=1 Tax=Pleurotus eryngii TaxID=5323 RepID=A0A9P5ZYK5_PLEER|nr:zf-CSL-domain-containing protein [Pleurotus eryngii]